MSAAAFTSFARNAAGHSMFSPAASGVSRSMLSQIERELANPTLAVTVRIASALGLSMSELVDQASPAPGIEVIRADDRSHIFRSDQNCSIRTLSPLHLEKDVEFYEVLLQPGGPHSAPPLTSKAPANF